LTWAKLTAGREGIFPAAPSDPHAIRDKLGEYQIHAEGNLTADLNVGVSMYNRHDLENVFNKGGKEITVVAC